MLVTQKDNVIGNYNPIAILLLVLKSNTVIMEKNVRETFNSYNQF